MGVAAVCCCAASSRCFSSFFGENAGLEFASSCCTRWCSSFFSPSALGGAAAGAAAAADAAATAAAIAASLAATEAAATASDIIDLDGLLSLLWMPLRSAWRTADISSFASVSPSPTRGEMLAFLGAVTILLADLLLPGARGGSTSSSSRLTLGGFCSISSLAALLRFPSFALGVGKLVLLELARGDDDSVAVPAVLLARCRFFPSLRSLLGLSCGADISAASTFAEHAGQAHWTSSWGTRATWCVMQMSGRETSCPSTHSIAFFGFRLLLLISGPFAWLKKKQRQSLSMQFEWLERISRSWIIGYKKGQQRAINTPRQPTTKNICKFPFQVDMKERKEERRVLPHHSLHTHRGQ